MLSQISATSTAYKFGIESAQCGEPFAPEAWFLNRQQQHEFALGFESVAGVSESTRQFTGSAMAQRHNWSDYNAKRALAKAEEYSQHLQAMVAKTAAENPEEAGNILWAV